MKRYLKSWRLKGNPRRSEESTDDDSAEDQYDCIKDWDTSDGEAVVTTKGHPSTTRNSTQDHSTPTAGTAVYVASYKTDTEPETGRSFGIPQNDRPSTASRQSVRSRSSNLDPSMSERPPGSISNLEQRSDPRQDRQRDVAFSSGSHHSSDNEPRNPTTSGRKKSAYLSDRKHHDENYENPCRKYMVEKSSDHTYLYRPQRSDTVINEGSESVECLGKGHLPARGGQLKDQPLKAVGSAESNLSQVHTRSSSKIELFNPQDFRGSENTPAPTRCSRRSSPSRSPQGSGNESDTSIYLDIEDPALPQLLQSIGYPPMTFQQPKKPLSDPYDLSGAKPKFTSSVSKTSKQATFHSSHQEDDNASDKSISSETENPPSSSRFMKKSPGYPPMAFQQPKKPLLNPYDLSGAKPKFTSSVSKTSKQATFHSSHQEDDDASDKSISSETENPPSSSRFMKKSPGYPSMAFQQPKKPLLNPYDLSGAKPKFTSSVSKTSKQATFHSSHQEDDDASDKSISSETENPPSSSRFMKKKKNQPEVGLRQSNQSERVPRNKDIETTIQKRISQMTSMYNQAEETLNAIRKASTRYRQKARASNDRLKSIKQKEKTIKRLLGSFREILDETQSLMPENKKVNTHDQSTLAENSGTTVTGNSSISASRYYSRITNNTGEGSVNNSNSSVKGNSYITAGSNNRKTVRINNSIYVYNNNSEAEASNTNRAGSRNHTSKSRKTVTQSHDADVASLKNKTRTGSYGKAATSTNTEVSTGIDGGFARNRNSANPLNSENEAGGRKHITPDDRGKDITTATGKCNRTAKSKSRLRATNNTNQAWTQDKSVSTSVSSKRGANTNKEVFNNIEKLDLDNSIRQLLKNVKDAHDTMQSLKHERSKENKKKTPVTFNENQHSASINRNEAATKDDYSETDTNSSSSRSSIHTEISESEGSKSGGASENGESETDASYASDFMSESVSIESSDDSTRRSTESMKNGNEETVTTRNSEIPSRNDLHSRIQSRVSRASSRHRDRDRQFASVLERLKEAEEGIRDCFSSDD